MENLPTESQIIIMSFIIDEVPRPVDYNYIAGPIVAPQANKMGDSEYVEDAKSYLPDSAKFKIVQDLEDNSISLVAYWGTSERGPARRIFKMSDAAYPRLMTQLLSTIEANADLLASPDAEPRNTKLLAAV